MRSKWLCLAGLILALTCPLAAPGCFGQDTEVVVAKGNNLISICEVYLDDPGDWPLVAAANRLIDPNWIYPGQRIVIPAKLLKGVPLSGVVTFVKGVVEIQQEASPQWRHPRPERDGHRGKPPEDR